MINVICSATIIILADSNDTLTSFGMVISGKIVLLTPIIKMNPEKVAS